MNRFYRVVSGKTGIYEAVSRACPPHDPRRVEKPDGAWLPRIGVHFDGAISLWTEAGMNRYVNSGLLHWHASVVQNPPTVLQVVISGRVLYSDTYQVLCDPETVQIVSESKWDDFAEWKTHGA